MKVKLEIETAEIEYSTKQLEKIIAHFSPSIKKKSDMSGQLPTLNKPKQRNANKCSSRSKKRKTS